MVEVPSEALLPGAAGGTATASLGRLRDLRHVLATHLISTGHDVCTVADRGGWANPSVLLSTYTHRVPEAARRAAAAMDDWLDGEAAR